MCKHKVDCCVHVAEFMKFQTEIIEEHIDAYKYFKGIANKNEAICSFVKEYGWLIREMWCKKACNESCDVWESTIKFGNIKHKEITDEEEFDARR